MSLDERALQLEAFAALAHMDVETSQSLRTFLPLWRHARSFGDDVLIVLGARGSGKTALFTLARDARTASKLRAFFGNQKIPEALWIDAFSQNNRNHPDVGVMERFGIEASDIALRAFWVAHLLRVARHEVEGLHSLPDALQTIVASPPNDLSTWVPLAEANLGPVFTALDAVDKHLATENRTVVALYDYIDRIAQFVPDVRRRYVRALLSLWLSLTNRYQHLRGKIFLRDDLFQASEIDFTDATKLRARSETLEWGREALYRVIVRHVVNLPEKRNAEAARRLLGEIPGLVLEDRGEFGMMPLEMSEDVFKAFVARVGGKVVGRGVVKGATHAWILRRLEDAQKRITPRAMMWMFGHAAEAAQARARGRGKSLYSSADLLSALKRTSKDRAFEVLEEDKLAKRLENLRGHQIPFSRPDIVTLLGVRRADEEPGIPDDGESVLEELIRLGLLSEDENGQIDVPDIYRYGFAIGPDYATAWRDLLDGKEASVKQFVREAPDLAGILRRINVPWGEIGEEELAKGDIAGARRKCNLALKMARSTDDKLAEADAWSRLALIDSVHVKDYVRARTEYEKALILAQRAHDSNREMAMRWHLGLEEADLKNSEAARDHFTMSLSLARDCLDWQYIALGHWGLAYVEEAEGHDGAALREYLKALAVSQENGVDWVEKLVWYSLGRFAHARGETAVAIQFAALADKSYDGDAAGFDVDQLRKEALLEYERDKGHSLLARAFPEVPLSSLADE